MPNKEVQKQSSEGESINLDQEQPDLSPVSPHTVVDPETPQTLTDKKDNLNFNAQKIEPFEVESLDKTVSEAAKKEQIDQKKTCWQKHRMIIGWILLPCCLMGGSSVGPSSNLLAAENDWVKTCWSWYLRLFYLLPGFICEIIFT